MLIDLNFDFDLDGMVKRLEDRIDSNEEEVLKKACAVVERNAKQLATKGETGELARTITFTIVEENGEKAGLVFSPLEYAPYVEYGTGLFAENGNGRKEVPWFYQDEKGAWHKTSGMHPHPFLRPALQQSRKQIDRIVKGGLLK